ncbi:hypothetical protein ScPMuIL_005338 [Solemya velum]
MDAWIICSICLLALQMQACNGQNLSFLVVGDWGGMPWAPYTTFVEQACAKQMSLKAEEYKTEFTLALGDNFYFDGVTSVDDKRFKETFEDIFTSKDLYKPWFVLAGNHDHRGNVSAQIQYTKYSSRWKFPDYYYNFTVKVPQTSTVVEIVMIDTVVLCGGSDDFAGSQPQGPEDDLSAQTQWQWIERTLSSSRADFLLVAGHYPVYSIAEHGPTKCLIKQLLPLLQKYNVTAYLSGHDHNLQHLQTESSGKEMNFFVIGSGNFIENSKIHLHDVPVNSSKFFFAEYAALGGFSAVHVTSSVITFQIIDGVGNQVYKYQLPPRKIIS